MDYQRSENRHSGNFATGVTCYSCGRHGHKWSDPNCPARNGHCYYCGENGHFANCCSNRYQRGRPPSFNSERHDSEQREDVTTSTVSVSAVDCCKSRRNSQRIHCLLDGEHIHLRVDLGSQISVISYAPYKRLLSRHKLRRANVTLSGYGAAPIICFGYLDIPVDYGNVHIPSFRFYVTKRGDCLLGADLFKRIGFRIWEPSDVSSTISDVDSVVSDVPC